MLHPGPLMNTVRSRVLVVDEREGALLRALGPSLAHHDVEMVHDATEAIYKIDCAGSDFDVIFCDVGADDA
jgi:CheY-like chemotaxis protein